MKVNLAISSDFRPYMEQVSRLKSLFRDEGGMLNDITRKWEFHGIPVLYKTKKIALFPVS